MLLFSKSYQQWVEYPISLNYCDARRPLNNAKDIHPVFSSKLE
jgi:hypothetical protein